MYYCDNCPLLNKMTPILPTGSISPDIYFLGSITSKEDIENKQLYSEGSESVYLNNMIRTTEVSNYRIFNMIRCTTNKSYDEFEEVKNCCFNFAKFDIVKTKPKIIILLGTLPSKELLGDKFKSIKENGTKVYNIEIDGFSTKVIPTYSISSIMDNFSYSSELMNSLLLAKSVLEGKVVDINSKEILVATSYKEFEDYYNNNLSKSDFISYDIETNALDPRSEDAEIVGFSMSADGSSGMYVSRMSLSHRIPEEEWDKIVKLAVSIISNNKILVHNCMYEIPFTLNKFNHYITNFEDSLIKARLVLGGTIGAGLKPQCIKYLGYPEWDKDLSDFLSSMSEIISGLKPSTSGKSRQEYTTLLNGSIKDLTYIESDKKRELSIKNSSVKLIKLVCEYYDNYEERINILDLIKSEIISRVNIGFSGILSYGVVPLEIISRYGAIDSIATHDLNKYLDGRIESLSKELKINLTNGYKYLKQHFISGTWMELSGLHWDDKIANEEYKWYSDKCIETSMNMVNSGLLDEYLFSNNLSVYNDYLVEDHLDELIDVFGEFDIKKTGIKLKSTGKLIRYKNILSELGQEYIDSNHDKILSMIKNKISQIKDYTDIKYYYNPSSTLPEVIKYTTNFLVTDEIKLAKFLDVLMTTKDTLHSISTELELLRTIDDYDKYNKLYGEYESSDNKDEFYLLNKDSIEGNIYYNGEFVKISSRDRFLKFYEVLENTVITNKDIEKLLMESYKFSKDSLSELDIIELNHLYILTGIDYDNLDTWTTEYKFLVNYRIWKKCNKIITSYINGNKVGRGSVYIVDKKDYSSGSLLTPRKRLYDGIVKDDEDCVMQSKLGVCTAESYRWRSGMHTIPMGSSVRHIYTSRFKGGVIAAPDFSQMELRTMSGAAHCEPMIEAFRNGADIHLMNASKIFRKPPEEITHEERRYAKMSSFMILYGGDYKNFSQEFLNGDEKLGKYIYDSFYSAYPEVENYIKMKHKEAQDLGKVTTLMDMFMYCTPEMYKGDINRQMRVAQNSVIQSASSMIAGCCLYQVMKYIQDHNLKTKIILFVHDSIEIDIPPEELLEVSSNVVPLMNKFPNEQFKMPVKADLVIGASLGKEVTVNNIECDDSYNEGTLDLEGYDDEIEEMITEWKKIFKLVEVEQIGDYDKEFKSWSQLWIPKLAMQKGYGKTRLKSHKKVHVIIK